MSIRFLPIGPHSFLVELADLERTQGLFDALTEQPLPEIAEIIPAARTLMIRTHAGYAADVSLAGQIKARLGQLQAQRPQAPTETVEIPVHYDGEDLADVAQLMGLTIPEVVAAHQDAQWQVAFSGFAPGFAYVHGDDPRFDLPRRKTPRTRIPAGSVALAARFCGIYPQDTPGGWQLIGTTTVPMWDLTRKPAALLRPGVRVRFVDAGAQLYPVQTVAPTADHAPADAAMGLRVLGTAFPLLFQDDGRPGQAGQGISGSGALDREAFHRANHALGNPANTPALELTLGPVELEAETALTLAVTGAAQDLRLTLDSGTVQVPAGAAFAMDAGDRLQVLPPKAGMRSYLALRGGFQVAQVLGSASSDTLAFVGPSPVKAGDLLVPAQRRALAVADVAQIQPALPAPGQLVLLPVTLGPRTDWFSSQMVAQFLAQEWQVTAQSSRVGIRLLGAQPILRDNADELPSEGTETGAIQIPHSGQPVLFLADHPLTGGYPVIATLMPDVLDLAGQIPPGARIRFTADHVFAAIEPKDPL